MNVLIIEPLRELARVLAEALDHHEISAVVACNAQDGIKKADEKTPDIVVMELLIPRHNGLEFIHEFRSYPEWLDIPIILYSNISREELGLEDSKLHEMGIVGYLYKPTTSLESLIKSVESNFASVDI
ncbi:MAG TPA: response regulator [Patescibacteria group bacterium]|nr:response regulator [Patescibacteria group bacterium]